MTPWNGMIQICLMAKYRIWSLKNPTRPMKPTKMSTTYILLEKINKGLFDQRDKSEKAGRIGRFN